MSANDSRSRPASSRRQFLQMNAAALSTAALSVPRSASAAKTSKAPESRGRPTEFQIACMTLPYSRFPLDRALEAIGAAEKLHDAKVMVVQ